MAKILIRTHPSASTFTGDHLEENTLQKCHITWNDRINANSFTKCVNLESYVRGHHVNKGIWTPTIGEELLCKMEANNIKDNYAVCVQNDGVIVGHLMLGKNISLC